jgi:hypothetical protein
VAVSEAGPVISRFEFTNGEQRGTHLSLYAGCLVHRSGTHLETLPLAAMSAIRVAFERHTRRLGWAVTLVVIALVMLAIAGPLGTFASTALAAGPQSVALMQGVYRLLEALASLLPVAALACLIGGIVLGVFGWLGSTTLVVALPGSERVYSVRGRDPQLLEFAEALSERLMLAHK